MIMKPLLALIITVSSFFLCSLMHISPAKMSRSSFGANLFGTTSADESEFDEVSHGKLFLRYAAMIFWDFFLEKTIFGCV